MKRVITVIHLGQVKTIIRRKPLLSDFNIFESKITNQNYSIDVNENSNDMFSENDDKNGDKVTNKEMTTNINSTSNFGEFFFFYLIINRLISYTIIFILQLIYFIKSATIYILL